MDTRSIAEFREQPDELLRQLKTTGRPLTLTVDGEPTAVVEDAEAYQHLLDLAAEASAEEGMRQGMRDIAVGRTRPAAEVFDEIRSAYGIPR